jgi:hypothetical protein
VKGVRVLAARELQGGEPRKQAHRANLVVSKAAAFDEAQPLQRRQPCQRAREIVGRSMQMEVCQAAERGERGERRVERVDVEAREVGERSKGGEVRPGGAAEAEVGEAASVGRGGDLMDERRRHLTPDAQACTIYIACRKNTTFP